MKAISRLLVAAALAASSLPSLGGGSGGGHSSAGYVFFTYPAGGYISFENQSDSEQMQRHCDEKGRLWVLGKKNPYRCNEFHRYGPLGGADVINIDGSSQKEREDNPTLLFSTKPFRNESWESKGLSETDSTELTELLSKGSNRFKAYRDAVSQQRAKAVGITSSRVTLYVIPGKKVVSEFSSTNKHLLVLRRNGQLSIKGEIGDAPRRYTDVNGDGIPEIVVALDCDGNCWELFDVSRRIKSLASMSDH